jgi:hypothetical protein
MEMQITRLKEPKVVKQNVDRPVINSKFETLYSDVAGFQEIKQLVLNSFRKRVKLNHKLEQELKDENEDEQCIIEVQLGFLTSDEMFYNQAIEKHQALTNFWKLALNQEKLRVVLRLMDCCWPKNEKVCLGCSIGKRNGQKSG